MVDVVSCTMLMVTCSECCMPNASLKLLVTLLYIIVCQPTKDHQLTVNMGALSW